MEGHVTGSVLPPIVSRQKFPSFKVPSILPIMMFVIVGVGFISMFILPTGVMGVLSSLVSMGGTAIGGLLLLKAKKELVR